METKSNHMEFLLRFLEVLRDICNRGITPTVSYDKREDVWTITDETPVQGQVVAKCRLQIIFKPGEIRFQVSRIMHDDSKMVKTSGMIPLEGDKLIEHINDYLEDLVEYGVLEELILPST